MPILHFDTDAGTNTVNTINTCTANMRNELNTMRNKVMTLTSSEWQGNSANDFQQEVQAWGQRVETTLTNLETLRQKLEREIQEWLQVAQTF